jgi:hypothetical protein
MPNASEAATKTKKPYSRPFLVVLDPAVAKEELKGKGDPNDEKVRKMLEFIPSRPKF